jgi:hypothetical protein
MFLRQLLEPQFATGFWMGLVGVWLLFLLAVVVLLGSLLLVAGAGVLYVARRRYGGKVHGLKAWRFRSAAVLEGWMM